MVQEERLQTDFSNSSTDVRHTIRNYVDGSLVREYWEPKRYIGCGGFGSVQLQRCFGSEVLWDYSEYEEEGDDGSATNNIGVLRAVKQISKPRGQARLSGQYLRELHSLVFFRKPKVCLLIVFRIGNQQCDQH